MLWGALIGALVGAAIELVGQRLSGRPIDWRRVGQAALVGGVTGLVGGAVAGALLRGGSQAAQAAPQVASVGRRVAAMSTAGGTGAAAGRVTDNALEGRPLHDGVVEHAAAGVVVGAAIVPVEAGVRRATGVVVERLRGRTGGPPPARAPPPQLTPLRPGESGLIDPASIRFTQTTAGHTAAEWTDGLSRADALRRYMRANGYGELPPLDVVITRSGPVALDNTRPAVARELGLRSVAVRAHAPDELLPEDMLGRFGDARTWGQAAAWRAGRQSPKLPPEGTDVPPRLPVEGTPPRGSGARPPAQQSNGFTSQLGF